ncbi:citrate-binding protein-like [Actinidia eriantha]|uniref:citrate-binding protein-like n=1 Tax=Actinidia eriantha TaxID=165200 RepID=UPI002587A7E4|nr:citrate-binding protein-like [Actinidia eriantha]
MNFSYCYALLFVVFVGWLNFSCGDPTDGFTNIPLTEANFDIQHPYNLPLADRYSYENGVRRLWVYSTDKPHSPNSRTQPRTEVRIRGLRPWSGVWQFEGYGYVPQPTSGATIAQIHGAAHDSSTIILRIYNGDMRYYSGDLIETNMYDRWFRLNIIHDVEGGKVTVFIDGAQKFETNDRGPSDDFYFKCGVYAAPKDISHYMESRWRDIKIYKK